MNLFIHCAWLCMCLVCVPVQMCVHDMWRWKVAAERLPLLSLSILWDTVLLNLELTDLLE